MKMIAKRLTRVCCVILVAATVSSPGWAQAQGFDTKPSLPQVMEVEGINVADNIVILDGERYRWVDSNARAGGESTDVVDGASGTQLRYISQLQRGMRVQVVTDGTRPSGSHAPRIIRMERAR